LVLQDEIKVELDEDNILHISGQKNAERKDDTDREGWKIHHMERSYASQHRSLRMPKNVDASRISANCENGVLHIMVPKATKQEDARRRIAVA
jgi:HSP20 family protein